MIVKLAKSPSDIKPETFQIIGVLPRPLFIYGFTWYLPLSEIYEICLCVWDLLGLFGFYF